MLDVPDFVRYVAILVVIVAVGCDAYAYRDATIYRKAGVPRLKWHVIKNIGFWGSLGFIVVTMVPFESRWLPGINWIVVAAVSWFEWSIIRREVLAVYPGRN